MKIEHMWKNKDVKVVLQCAMALLSARYSYYLLVKCRLKLSALPEANTPPPPETPPSQHVVPAGME